MINVYSKTPIFIENIKYLLLYILISIKYCWVVEKPFKLIRPVIEKRYLFKKWKNVKKALNSMSQRVYNIGTIDIKPHDKKNCPRSNGGQLMILMGITLAAIIIVTAGILTGIQNRDVDLPRERTQNILPEYQDIKIKFGIALANNLGSKYINREYAQTQFNQTRNNFITLEQRYGTFFNAEFKRIYYDINGNPNGIETQLTLRYGNKNICEKIKYYLW